jgi:DNA-binding response OmpR family regulator
MNHSPKTIIIVEDEPDTAEMLAQMMRMNGYEIIKAYSGGSAISLIAKEKPTAVVLDVMMPDISGIEVLKFVRNYPELAHTPVVVVSAKTLPSDIQKGFEAGASLYLTKPVAYLELCQAMENVIQTDYHNWVKK